MRPVGYVEPDSVAAAVEALGDGARLIAGGSDLIGELKEGTAAPSRLVSLAGVPSLRGIEPFEGGLRIGAMTTIYRLETGPAFTGPYAMLAEAARGVATPEIRNQGTLGGNLAQRPRCLHYRSALVPCLKKGGNGCPASESPYQNYLSIFGGPNCFAVHASDLAPPLIALNAEVVVEGPASSAPSPSTGRGPGGGVRSRRVPIASFFTGPDVDPTRENILAPEEVITHVLLPPMPAGWRGLYTKARERTAGDFPIVSGAIGYELAGRRMVGVRIVLGGVAPTPLRMTEAEAVLEGQLPSEELAKRAADVALSGAKPLTYNGFKVDLAHALIWRGIMRLAN